MTHKDDVAFVGRECQPALHLIRHPFSFRVALRARLSPESEC
jgi:hypothetical protein